MSVKRLCKENSAKMTLYLRRVIFKKLFCAKMTLCIGDPVQRWSCANTTVQSCLCAKTLYLQSSSPLISSQWDICVTVPRDSLNSIIYAKKPLCTGITLHRNNFALEFLCTEGILHRNYSWQEPLCTLTTLHRNQFVEVPLCSGTTLLRSQFAQELLCIGL